MTKEEIEKKLIAAKEAYYKSGDSDLTDAEYDALVEEYNTLYPESDFLKDGLQETLAGVSKKYKLPATMGTLAKCMDEKSFKKYWDSHPHADVVVEEKIDGCLDKDTVLETNLGNKTISEIVENKINCFVKSFDFDNDKIIYTPIIDWYINNNNFEWYEIELEDGRKIKVTENHKIYLPELKCWREVGKLKVGDELKID